MPGPALEQNHFLFEPEKDDQGHYKREANDEKGEDHHHGTVGELKGWMDFIYQGYEQDQYRTKCDNSLMNI
ncbi:hypothetical protein ES703_103431 [subsurface metagenome]